MTLYPFQQEGVAQQLKFLRENESHACYNASTVGTGKTLMTLEVLKHLDTKSQLIICPRIARFTWEEEIAKWCENGSIVHIYSEEDLPTHLDFQFPRYYITTYDLARKNLYNRLKYIQFDALVIDEAHKIKTTDSRQSKAILQDYFYNAQYKIFLSGTPCTKNIVDMYAPLSRILPKEFPDFDQFVNEYSNIKITPYGTEYFGIKNADKLQNILRSKCLIRYKAEEVVKDLPKVTHQTIYLPQELKLNYNDQIKEHYERLYWALNTNRSLANKMPEGLAAHRRLQGEAKVPAAIEFLASLIEQGESIVVFAYHREVIRKLEREISLRITKCGSITGATPDFERQATLKAFKFREIKVLIGQINACGVALNGLQEVSNICVIVEPDWSPAVIEQAIGRLNRIGQTKPVIVYHLVVKNSMDESITSILIRKAKEFKKVLDD